MGHFVPYSTQSSIQAALAGADISFKNSSSKIAVVGNHLN
jgi:hypothetical protein